MTRATDDAHIERSLAKHGQCVAAPGDFVALCGLETDGLTIDWCLLPIAAVDDFGIVLLVEDVDGCPFDPREFLARPETPICPACDIADVEGLRAAICWVSYSGLVELMEAVRPFRHDPHGPPTVRAVGHA